MNPLKKNYCRMRDGFQCTARPKQEIDCRFFQSEIGGGACCFNRSDVGFCTDSKAQYHTLELSKKLRRQNIRFAILIIAGLVLAAVMYFLAYVAGMRGA